jgi:hypothetical protein
LGELLVELYTEGWQGENVRCPWRYVHPRKGSLVATTSASEAAGSPAALEAFVNGAGNVDTSNRFTSRHFFAPIVVASHE